MKTHTLIRKAGIGSCILLLSTPSLLANPLGAISQTSLLSLLIVSISVCLVLFFYFQKQKKQAFTQIEELEKEKKEWEKKYEELRIQSTEKDVEISTLSSNRKELEQILVAKIKENDSILREAADREEAAKQQIKESESTQYAFFVNTIHEMRTPLSLILGSLGLAVQGKEPERALSSLLISAYRNTLSLQDLADQLIGARRADDIASYLRIARYNIVEIARQSCDLFVDWLEMNNVDFNFTTQANALWLWIDRRKMEYVIRTLLTNALKNTFMYGKITLGISVEKHNNKPYCALYIQDEGLDENESTRRGLKQIKDTIHALEGMYRKDTAPNGTTYSLYIPLGKKHLLERRVEFVEPEGDLVKLNKLQKEEISEYIKVLPQKRITGKKLLIIDDSDQIRWFLKHIFNKEYTIVEARNGEEGVNMAVSESPNLILCDVMMPIKDGFQACREIKNNERTTQIPIIMLTAKVETEDVIKGIESGADDYITKPFDVEVLRSKVNNLLKRRAQLKHYYTRIPLSEMTGETEAGENKPIDIEPLSPFMEVLIQTIEKHLDDPTFEAKVLAETLNISLPTLYRKIKQYSNSSILEITRSIRLKRAAELLATQRYSVHEVAEMVGFNDMATFRKRFTEQYGTTPSQYGTSSLNND
ncbi:two-component system sensor histidine kinase ChiS [Parabacteroides sp. PM5-20]|uniref:hybrid sensor histidine kinase/response regulator transcription factor n=1 Tax=unclassified Parabacteroides TaxID=2649774 RepID=UPI001EF2BAC6|nr:MULTISPECIES: response regulator [unclassified Parabacteroides]MDH6535611.1 two-component system sensor histidine kinase ChiS [Parabacteroides sp. PM5-20]